MPREEKEIKLALIRLAHDNSLHMASSKRTAIHLHAQALVNWVGMDADVAAYVSSCYVIGVLLQKDHMRRQRLASSRRRLRLEYITPGM